MCDAFYFIVQIKWFKIDSELLSIKLCLRKMCGFLCVGSVVLATLPGFRMEAKGHSPEERPHLDTQLPSFPSRQPAPVPLPFFQFEIQSTSLFTHTQMWTLWNKVETQWVNIRKSYRVHCSAFLSVLLSGTILAHSVILFLFPIPCFSSISFHSPGWKNNKGAAF